MRIWVILFSFLFFSMFTSVIRAQEVPNNRFGIHIQDPGDLPLAQELVNSNGGDWGYVTIVIQENDRDPTKWQRFFDDARRRHLIPLVRIATHPIGDVWAAPLPEDADAWAAFLQNLNWPTKDRHVILFNEPNHATEWGGTVSPEEYAQVFQAFATRLKQVSRDFFILNAGFDAAAPQEAPKFTDSARFMIEMNKAIPGIFESLDGWVSHSYPNPGFVGTPGESGKMTIRGYRWEESFLAREFGISNLPIFVTETGWPHAEGVDQNDAFHTADRVADFFVSAYTYAWNNQTVRAVTPFILRWKVTPFDHFSWIQDRSEDGYSVLGDQYPDDGIYPQFIAIQEMEKVAGLPVQVEAAELVQQRIPTVLVQGQAYSGTVTLRNTGQSIWGERGPFSIISQTDVFSSTVGTASARIEPQQIVTVPIPIKAPAQEGTYILQLGVFSHDQLDLTLSADIEVVSPPIITLDIEHGVNRVGERERAPSMYAVRIEDQGGNPATTFQINESGIQENIELRELLPRQEYTIIVDLPYHLPQRLTFTPQPGQQTVRIPKPGRGDLNDDNRLSISDLFILLRHPTRVRYLWNE